MPRPPGSSPGSHRTACTNSWSASARKTLRSGRSGPPSTTPATTAPIASLRRLSTLARSGTHLESLGEMRGRLESLLPVRRIEDLEVPFQCVAASVERAAEHWFDSGPLADVVLASCAVPGILPPVPIAG